jgi:CubicO group peptidase (beta-lactamase class C family)
MSEHWAARLHDLATEEEVQGAALGVWVDGQESVAAHGLLNAATGVSATPDALFQIGSITKVWTTTMIMQLIDEGRLSLDTTVAEILPGVRLGREDASAEVRIRHLLTHTSGIDGDNFTDTGRGADCLERYAAALASADRIFPPGAAYSYCNAGFVVLGRVIEVLDGREWDASLRERLVGPLGLAQTVTLPEEAILHRVAAGHREHPNQNQPVSVWGLPRSVGPAGLIIASAHNVLAFARLHLDQGVTRDGTRLLSQASASAMQQPQAQMPSLGRDEAIGLGWRLHRWDGRWIVGHDGTTIGQTAYLRIDPRARVAACPNRWTWTWSGTPAGTSAPRGGSTYRSATADCTWSPGCPAIARRSATTVRTSSTCTQPTPRATTSSAGRVTASPGRRWSSAVSAARRPTSTSAAG